MANSLYDYINGTMQSPLFLAGAGLVSGEGFGGAMQGMRMGMAAQDRTRQQAESDARKAAFEGLLSDPSKLPQGMPMGALNIVRAAGPEAGLPMLAGMIPKPKDPLDQEYKRAQINKLNQPERVHVGSSIVELGPTGPRELYKATDPVEQYLINRLQGRSSVAPQPQNPLLQKQSFDGMDPAGGGLQFVADERGIESPASAPSADIDTPYGRMTREEAMQLGGTMLLSPKYSHAGKALLDAAQSGKTEGLAKPTVNQIEEKTLNSASALARLEDIEKRFDPKFLEIPTRFKMLGASWSAKAGEALGGKLSPELKSQLYAFAQFRSASVNNLNTLLKELSGAAVTPQEYERLKNDIPNAGTGIFDGDDPVSFKAKSDRARSTYRAAIARYNFMRSKGLNFDRNSLDQFLSLDDVPAAIDKRGAEIEGQLRKSGADPRTIDQQVRRKLKQEFGI